MWWLETTKAQRAVGAMATTKARHLLELPDHVISLILVHLRTGRALLNAMEAHRTIADVVRNDPNVWKPLASEAHWSRRWHGEG